MSGKMSDEKRKGRERTSQYLRLMAGAYLMYLAWGLFKELAAGTVLNGWIAGAAGAFFGVFGLALAASSARYLYQDYWKPADREPEDGADGTDSEMMADGASEETDLETPDGK